MEANLNVMEVESGSRQSFSNLFGDFHIGQGLSLVGRFRAFFQNRQAIFNVNHARDIACQSGGGIPRRSVPCRPCQPSGAAFEFNGNLSTDLSL